MKLPQKRTPCPDADIPGNHAEVRGWNAAIDEVIRLNQPGRADEICAFNNWYAKNRGVLGQPGYKEDFQVWMARAQSGVPS